MPERLSLEGVETMLAERIEEWNRKLAEDNLQKGRQEGRQEGLLEGRREGEARALLRLLEKKFGALPKSAQSRIAKAELTRLSEWFDRAVTAERLDEVFDA
jgi:flagellar biosynthesis/type III secretory pathway protein FliH